MELNERHSSVPLVVLIAGSVLFATGLIFHAFLYNFYLDALGLSPAVMGYQAAALTVGSLATLIPAGQLADRVGTQPTLIIGALVLTFGLLLGAVAATPVAVCAAAVVAGAGSGFWRVAMPPALMRLSDRASRPRAFAWSNGLLVAWYGAGLWIAAGVSEWLEGRGGLNRLTELRVALVVGAVGSIASLVLFWTLRMPAARAPAADEGLPAAGREPLRDALVLVGLIGLWMLGPALSSQFLNIFFARTQALSIPRIGWIFGVAAELWAVAVLLSGELARRVGIARPLFASLLLFTPAIWGLSLAHSVSLAVVLYVVQGVVAPVSTPLIDQWLLARTPPTRQGTVSSWRQVAADLSAIAGATLGGRLLGAGGFPTLFVVAGAVALAGAVGLMARARGRPS